MKRFVLSSSASKRLISTLMSSRSADSSEIHSFSLKSTHEFASRSGSVFGELNILEKSHEQWVSKHEMFEPTDESEDTNCVQKDLALIQKPLATVQRKRKACTTYQSEKRCRKKWTRYSLEDIPVSSDATNTAVALQFFDELRMRKSHISCSDKDVDNTEKVVFRKPKSPACLSTHKFSAGGNSLLPSHSATKFTLLTRKQRERDTSNIKLGHLYDDDSDNI